MQKKGYPLAINKEQLVESIIHEIRQSGQQVEADLEAGITRVVTGYNEDKQPSQRREVTILLSDIIGFSEVSERFKASQIVTILNRYFTKMSEIIEKYDGVVDKYMGDTIMAYFADTEQSSDHAHRAVNCAVEMQIAMNEVNNDNEVDGLPSLYMGIGINTGIVTFGQMGSQQQNEYTLIGDGVNLATSVGSHSLRGQVLISDYTYQQVKDVVEIGDINEARIKGKNEMVKLYEITASNWQEKITVPMREIRSSVRVNVDMEFPFQIIENHEAQPDILFGRARDISYKGIYAIIKQPVGVQTEIKLSLSLSLLGNETRDIYGKVKSIKETDEGYGCGIEFDDLDIDSIEAVRNYIHRIIEGC